jgi:hypothetical protein
LWRCTNDALDPPRQIWNPSLSAVWAHYPDYRIACLQFMLLNFSLAQLTAPNAVAVTVFVKITRHGRRRSGGELHQQDDKSCWTFDLFVLFVSWVKKAI